MSGFVSPTQEVFAQQISMIVSEAEQHPFLAMLPLFILTAGFLYECSCKLIKGSMAEHIVCTDNSKHYLEPKLPSEITEIIFNFLSTRQLMETATVSTQYNNNVQRIIAKRAGQAGYKASKFVTPNNYLKALFSLIDTGVIPKHIVVRDKEEEIDFVATYKTIRTVDNIELLDIELHNICLFSLKRKNRKALIMALLMCGANPNVKGKDNRRPLHYAAMNVNDRKNIAILLFENGAKIDAKDNDGQTPLHWAAYRGNKDMAALLLENRANINAKNKKGYTPLYLAAFERKIDVVALLIKLGANIETQDIYGQTLLHYAAFWGEKDMAILLFEKGANIEAKSNKGKTPLHCSAMYGKGVLGLLQNIDCKIDILDYLTKLGAKVDAKDNNGRTPLHLAVILGNKDSAALLLEKNAKVDAEDDEGNTPLDIARQRGHTEIAELIIDALASRENSNTQLDRCQIY
ncbi:MAG: ankyrin repeat domain-containing protein [Chlamydiales bacterium]|nr:ankyrin repeat domain-containing protein [Chlamydiales bacterium]